MILGCVEGSIICMVDAHLCQESPLIALTSTWVHVVDVNDSRYRSVGTMSRLAPGAMSVPNAMMTQCNADSRV